MLGVIGCAIQLYAYNIMYCNFVSTSQVPYNITSSDYLVILFQQQVRNDGKPILHVVFSVSNEFGLVTL